jgi:eukaryotic-like serine/threonine-protein kinase
VAGLQPSRQRYRARDARLRPEVALKILPVAFASDPDRVRRFEQEGRSAATLNHANIVVIYDARSEGGVFYVATELLEGETLRKRLAGSALACAKSARLRHPDCARVGRGAR